MMTRSLLVIAWVLAMLSGASASAEDSCPNDMVPTGTGTCIDRYPWPNREGEKPLVGASALQAPIDEESGRVLDATRLCESVGKRVCRIDEWQSACRGPEGSKYPWGATVPKQAPLPCNADKHFRAPDEMKIARRNAEEFSRLDQSEAAGSRPCVSASGARDMLGNVEQWVECPGVGKYGWCLVGRFWSSLQSCEFKIATHAPRWFYYETGVRCCK